MREEKRRRKTTNLAGGSDIPCDGGGARFAIKSGRLGRRRPAASGESVRRVDDASVPVFLGDEEDGCGRDLGWRATAVAMRAKGASFVVKKRAAHLRRRNIRYVLMSRL